MAEMFLGVIKIGFSQNHFSRKKKHNLWGINNNRPVPENRGPEFTNFLENIQRMWPQNLIDVTFYFFLKNFLSFGLTFPKIRKKEKRVFFYVIKQKKKTKICRKLIYFERVPPPNSGMWLILKAKILL